MALKLWNKYRLQPPRPPGTASVVGNNDGATSADALPTQTPAQLEYAEAAKHAAQRYHERVAHVEQLTTECDDWRSRALGAENEVARLLKREAALLAQIDAKSNAALKEVEEYKTVVEAIGAQYGSAGKLLLDGFAALDKAGLRVNVDLSSMAALAAALAESRSRAVTEGPRPAEPVSTAGVAQIERSIAEIAGSLRSELD
jgi:hypothetical protein